MSLPLVCPKPWCLFSSSGMGFLLLPQDFPWQNLSIVYQWNAQLMKSTLFSSRLEFRSASFRTYWFRSKEYVQVCLELQGDYRWCPSQTIYLPRSTGTWTFCSTFFLSMFSFIIFDQTESLARCKFLSWSSSFYHRKRLWHPVHRFSGTGMLS